MAQSFAILFVEADDKEGLCWHLFRWVVCLLLADGKDVCRPGPMPLSTAMQDVKEAVSSSEGESITEGFYINTIASPMKRE